MLLSTLFTRRRHPKGLSAAINRKRLRQVFFARGASCKGSLDCPVCWLPAAAAAIATAVATAAEAAAASAASARPAILARARLVDRQAATVQVFAVELLDGGLALFLRRHLDEAEAARAARVAVFDDVGRLDRTGLREEVAQVFAGGLEREVPDVEFHGHVNFLLPRARAFKRSFSGEVFFVNGGDEGYRVR